MLIIHIKINLIKISRISLFLLSADKDNLIYITNFGFDVVYILIYYILFIYLYLMKLL
jgi:hypothetical protein